jgi:transcriptional regulator with XRE-family HTH domain
MADFQGEKFKEYLRKNNISVITAAEKLGVSRNTVYQYFSSDNLSRETVSNIITKLNTTEEDVFGIIKEKIRLEAVPLRLADPFGFEATGDKIYTLADGSLMMEVPIIPIRAQAGYVHNYQYPEFYEDLATIPVMIDTKAFSTYMAFEVSGDSMVNLSTYELAEKSIFPGRIAVGRLLDKSKWRYKLHTHNYDSWIIVHNTKGIVCKTIADHDVDKGLITIHSLNPEFEDEVWDLNEIDQIFSIVKIDQNKR